MKFILLALLSLPALSKAGLHCKNDSLSVKIENDDYAIIDVGQTHLEIGGITKSQRNNFGLSIISFRKDQEFSLVGFQDFNNDGKRNWTLEIPGIVGKTEVTCK